MKKETLRRVTNEVAQKPTEGKWFWVNPEVINWELFKEEREDPEQERTRKLICEAYEALKVNQEKYARPFRVLIPEKEWESESIGFFQELASDLGDHDEDWIEICLEWAQRICNGESWRTVCNEADTAKWHRIIKWKNGNYKLVGGALANKSSNPPSYVGAFEYFPPYDYIKNTGPAVVAYEQ